MDSVDLIARENEFKKLNKQLEKKTESLMKEIEEVMQKPDIFSTTPNFKLNLNSTPTRKHHCYSPKSPSDALKTQSTNNRKEKHINLERKVQQKFKEPSKDQDSVSDIDKHREIDIDDNCVKTVCVCCPRESNSDVLEFLYAFVSVNVKENVLPQSFVKGKVTVECVCKCLAAKVKLLQEQVDKLQSTIDKKNKQCEAHLTHVAELESERLGLLNSANTMKCETADMKAKYLAIQNRLNEKDRLYKEQRSATDKLTVEIKQYKSKNTNLEARCASQEEVIANLKQQVETVKLSEKEYRASTRTLCASHETTIDRLKREISARGAHAARQRALIDNLRAQRALLLAQHAAHKHTQL